MQNLGSKEQYPCQRIFQSLDGQSLPFQASAQPLLCAKGLLWARHQSGKRRGAGLRITRGGVQVGPKGFGQFLGVFRGVGAVTPSHSGMLTCLRFLGVSERL